MRIEVSFMEMKYGPVYHVPQTERKTPISISFLGINHCSPHYCNVRNHSRITVIAFILNGQGEITLGSHMHTAAKGDIFLLPKGYRHQVKASQSSADEWQYIWMNVAGELAVQLLAAYRLLDSAVIHCPDAEGLFREAIELAQTKTAQAAQQMLPPLLLEIFIKLSDVKSLTDSDYSHRVQAIKSYLDNHIQEDFQSGALSKHFRLSFKQINRLFKQETGMTVYHYVLKQKIESAKMMLAQTELSVSEIAYKLGYGDPQYFSNLFKKKAGSPPSQYRSDHR
jgi:YesN/AraC family two-component response regulator